MARKTNDFLKGVIGSITLREQRGKQIISQKVPKGTIKHTASTKRAANTFGMASALGKQIRTSFLLPVGGLGDPFLVNRMNAKLVQMFTEHRDPETRRYEFERSSFDVLDGFDFNTKSPLKRTLQDPVKLEWANNTLNCRCGKPGIPLKLKFPRTGNSCDLLVSIAILRLDEGTRTYATLKQSITIQKDEPFLQGINLDFRVPSGCLFVASIFLRFYSFSRSRDILVNTKKFSPAMICGAQLTPGPFQDTEAYQWTPMDKIKFDYQLLPDEL